MPALGRRKSWRMRYWTIILMLVKMTKTSMKPSLISSRLGWPSFPMAGFSQFFYRLVVSLVTWHAYQTCLDISCCSQRVFGSQLRCFTVYEKSIHWWLCKSSVEIPRYKTISQDVRGRVSQPHGSPSLKSKFYLKISIITLPVDTCFLQFLPSEGGAGFLSHQSRAFL